MVKPFSAYEGEESYTFVCYAHEDADIVYQEIAWLREQGVNIWYDEGISAGANWRASIGDSLINADRVLFYVSHASLKSDHCNREINLALDEGKQLVPVYLESVELTSDLKVGLNRVQALHREKDADYRQHLLSVLGAQSNQAGATHVESQFSIFGRRRIRLTTALSVGLIIGAVGVILGVWTTAPSEPGDNDRPIRRFAIDIGQTETILSSDWPVLSSEVAISRDGAQFAYLAQSGGVRNLFIRNLASIETTAVYQGSMNSPFFSPDGQWIAFYLWTESVSELIKVSIADGVSQKIADAYPATGAVWLPDGTIIHSNNTRGSEAPGAWPDGHGESLFRVSANGGEPEQLTWVDVEAGEWAHSRPSVLPGGEHVLFDRVLRDVATDVALLDLASGSIVILIEQARGAHYVASGHIVFVREGAVWAVLFDLDNLEIAGVPAVIETSVTDVPGYGNWPVAIAADGSAVIVPATAEVIPQRRPVWVDRQGRVQTSSVPAGPYTWPRVSPDGKRVVFPQNERGNQDLWLHDFERPGSLFRLTFDKALDATPIWDPDGIHLLFGSTRDGQFNIYRMRGDGAGTPERLIQSPLLQAPGVFTPDGATLIYGEQGPESSFDIGAYSLDGSEDPQIIFGTEFREGAVTFSPDGKWMAYGSDEGGGADIYVRPYPNLHDGKWQVSTHGGSEAFWSPAGDEIFYRNGNSMMAVPVTTTPAFKPGLPHVLFEDDYYRVPLGSRQYDVSNTDGEKFLMLEVLPDRNTTRLIHVDNWLTKVERLAPRP